jgi:hypothetical protein
VEAHFTLVGWGTGFGRLSFGDFSVPAFGPQALPLHDPTLFGIAQKKNPNEISGSDSFQLCGWSRCYAERTAWIHLNASAASNRVTLSFQAIGIEKTRLVFYVQAKTCRISEGPTFFPGDLTSYQGYVQKIVFNQQVFLCSNEECKIQLIPLSGTECFWNATFLIAFEFFKTRSCFDFINLELYLESAK